MGIEFGPFGSRAKGASRTDRGRETQAGSNSRTDCGVQAASSLHASRGAQTNFSLRQGANSAPEDADQPSGTGRDMQPGRDQLTGLPGIDALRLAIASSYGEDAEKYSGGPVLVAFDIENFKAFNTAYGFEGGDKLLISVANLLVETFPGCTITRMSEDHFFAVVPYGGIERKVMQLHEHVHDFQRDVKIEFKAGIYPLTNPDEPFSAACDAARFACNSIKRRSELAYRIYDEQLGELIQRRRYVVDNLDRALEEGWIKVYYQPVVRVQTGKVCGFEALARWDDPEHGLLPPDSFIGPLEDYHIIHKLDMHVMRLACADYHRTELAGKSPLPFSINISRLDFELCDVTLAVTEAARDFDVPPSMMEIEVTESTMSGNAELVHQKLNDFRRFGFQVWMDDFGSGYSSLNLLKDYSFDVLKIDMVFLRDLTAAGARSQNARIVIASIVGMAKQLGIQTLAEGVETPDQLEFLRRVGCEKSQGYLFSRPLAHDDLMRVLKDKGIEFEPTAQRAYYDRVGRVDLLGGHLLSAMESLRATGRSLGAVPGEGVGTPMAVVEVVDRTRIEILGSNDAFEKFVEEIKLEGMLDNRTPAEFGDITLRSRVLDAFAAVSRAHSEQDIDFIRDGQLCNVSLQFIAECENRTACLITARNLSVGRGAGTLDELSSALRALCGVYSRIDLIALDESFAKAIYTASSRYRPFLVADNGRQTLEQYADENIHPTDQARFLEFYDLSTLADRLSHAESGYLEAVFCTLDTDGAYNYQVYTLIPYVSEGRDCALSFVHDALPPQEAIATATRHLSQQGDWVKNRIAGSDSGKKSLRSQEFE